MKKHALTVIAIAISLHARLRADEAAPVNPALLYWQAAALLPALNESQMQDLREMAIGKKPVDPAKWKGLGLGRAEELLRKAAASTAPCDWGLAMEDGPAMVLPHLSKVLELARIATVEAEVSLAQGRTGEGIDWLLAVHHIARHAGAGDTLISCVVQMSIDTAALRATARHCLAWDETTRHDLEAKLKALPPPHSTRNAYRGELSMIAWLERQLDLPEPQRTEKLKWLALQCAAPGEGKSQTGADNGPGQFSPETLRRAIAEYRALNTRSQSVAEKPWKEGRVELDEIQKAVNHSEYSLVRQSYPALAAIYDKAFVVLTMRTMLYAALENGGQIDETKAASYKDAFENEPLRVEKSPDGSIRLVAARQHPAGTPVELKLGR